MMEILKRGKLLVFCALLCLLFATVASAAGSGDVASAVESTWTTASEQIKTVVDSVLLHAEDSTFSRGGCGFLVDCGTILVDDISICASRKKQNEMGEQR